MPTFTRLAGRFATREAAEDALAWAVRYAARVPLEVRRHQCEKPAHQAEPWLLLSVVRIGEETAAQFVPVGVNGHEGER